MRYTILFVCLISLVFWDTNPLLMAENITSAPINPVPTALLIKNSKELPFEHKPTPVLKSTNYPEYDSIFSRNSQFLFDGFDFPVGKPDAKNYFRAVKFGQRLHLGEDWNGIHGGNSDLGDPVYSIGHGYVSISEHLCCGWGNIIRVIHKMPYGHEHDYIESVYAHLHNMEVRAGDLVRRGDKIGTIGTADGKYSAHLHLELRSFIGMNIGPGYSEDNFGYLNPTPYIQKNRPY